MTNRFISEYQGVPPVLPNIGDIVWIRRAGRAEPVAILRFEPWGTVVLCLDGRERCVKQWWMREEEVTP